MKVLKRIINKHMSFSIGTLFALMIMTGVTACESCNTKPSTDGKPSISIKGGKEENGKIVFQDSEGKENRTVTVIVDLDDDSKSNSKSAIYANYLLNVTLKGAGELTYESFDKQGKSVSSKVTSEKLLTGETLEHFIKDAIDGTLESAHEIEFKFCPAIDVTEMEATFELRDKNSPNDSIDKKVVVWKAAEKPKDDKKESEEKEGLLKKIEEKEAEIAAIENSINQIKLSANSDVIKSATGEQVDSVKAELDKTKASVELIINEYNAIVANSADEEIKGRVAGDIQKAQQLLTQIQQIETQLASKLAHERPELLIEKVKEKKVFMVSQYALLKKALDKKKEGVKLATAKNELAIIEKAKEEIETIAGYLKECAGEDKEVEKQVGQAIKNAESASKLANKAREEYEKADKENAIAEFEEAIKAATEAVKQATTLLNGTEEGNLAEVLKEIALAKEKEQAATLALDTRLKSYLVNENDKQGFQLKLGAVRETINTATTDYNQAMSNATHTPEATAAAADKSAEGEAAADKSAEGEAPADKSAEGEAPADKSAEGEAPADKSAEGTPADKSAEGTPADKSAEGTPADVEAAIAAFEKVKETVAATTAGLVKLDGTIRAGLEEKKDFEEAYQELTTIVAAADPVKLAEETISQYKETLGKTEEELSMELGIDSLNVSAANVREGYIENLQKKLQAAVEAQQSMQKHLDNDKGKLVTRLNNAAEDAKVALDNARLVIEMAGKMKAQELVDKAKGIETSVLNAYNTAAKKSNSKDLKVKEIEERNI
ncbi:MAG: coiled-coil domain-containing protein [Candidatus Amoebophilus sp.]